MRTHSLLLLLLLTASTLLACGAPLDAEGGILYDPCDPIVIVPSEATNQVQRDGIVEAIALWREVGLTTLTLDPEGVLQRVPIQFNKGIAMFHGTYAASIGELRINSVMEDRALDITIAHELGHALGLAHVPSTERSSLMNPGNSTVVPTTDDGRQLRERWSCLPSP